MKPVTFWQRVGRGVRDRSFIIGSILVILFLLAAVLGPELAPRNPYIRDRIQTIDGELQRAPFPPSWHYPLGTDTEGRDLLSLLLHGARQTLVIAFVAMTIRMLLGLVLGTVCGWWPGGPFDRAVTAVTEFLAAFPTLVLAMLLVYAVGIRRGQISFVIAVSLVGWGEVTQIVRGHVVGIRSKLYISAARAVGLSSPEILCRHVLPNLLSTLLALATLEMAGVLLLLAELGLLNVFIGGGVVYIDDARGRFHYYDVPDWGAMLGISWRFFRSKPWIPLAPALSFLVSILGFNLFGYGLQRFVEKGRFHPSGWSVLRFLAVVGVLLFGARTLLASTGADAAFVDIARQFDVQRAWNDILYLTQPELEGRLTGPGGGYQGAGYIAYQFRQAGLTPLTDGTYFQQYRALLGEVVAPAVLEALGEDGEPVLRLEDEVSFDPLTPFEDEGIWQDELVVVGNMNGDARTGLILLLNPWESMGPTQPLNRPSLAVIRLVPDDEIGPDDLAPIHTATMQLPQYPNLLIGESGARRLLALAGIDLDQLQANREAGERIALHTGLQVRITAGLTYHAVRAANVVGYLPAADVRTQGERILVAASYTGPPAPEGTVYPGADEDASAVAVMMEVARLWHDIGFEPKRTVVFTALDSGGGEILVNHPVVTVLDSGDGAYSGNPLFSPTDLGDSWTVITVHGIGAGDERLARLEVGAGLARTFDSSARRMGIDTTQPGQWRLPFAGGFRVGWLSLDTAYTGLAVTRLGDERSGTPADTPDHLDPQLVAEAGWTLAHYLMVLSSR